jgi:hypothetical protein
MSVVVASYVFRFSTTTVQYVSQKFFWYRCVSLTTMTEKCFRKFISLYLPCKDLAQFVHVDAGNVKTVVYSHVYFLIMLLQDGNLIAGQYFC